MILHLANIWQKILEKKVRNVILGAEVYASLNNRKPKQLLIDPKVNLAATDY